MANEKEQILALLNDNVQYENRVNKIESLPWKKAILVKLENIYDDDEWSSLKDKLNKHKAIKTLLLDQSIITGIGNIYADEILFLSKINPERDGCNLTNKNLHDIITNTRDVLSKAIEMGGTTIHTYTSVDGITGLFQQELLVHGKKDMPCPNCKTKIEKIVVGGRGTYYCPKCQKKH